MTKVENVISASGPGSAACGGGGGGLCSGSGSLSGSAVSRASPVAENRRRSSTLKPRPSFSSTAAPRAVGLDAERAQSTDALYERWVRAEPAGDATACEWIDDEHVRRLRVRRHWDPL